MSEAMADRDAKRRARYRGNPERARYQRQPDSEQFTITTKAHVRSPQELIQRFCHVSLTDEDDRSSKDDSCFAPEEHLVATTTPAYASLINDIPPSPPTPLKDALPDEEPDAEPLVPVDEPDEETVDSPPPPPDKNKPSTQRRRQQKQQQSQQPRTGKTTNPVAAVDETKGAPSRFTRSMARKIGGIQPPRRYFGEGVSESQILH
ncbi:hypothetical protein GGF42_001500 [Coemansia sp. RSA 2424]|nr:hypothetical protein GGF42_001500 [Coemansia sp. RSA 2424]